MKNYKFILNSKDLNSTNECLMKLWASFLNNGKLAWHYRPYKIKNIIDVGDVSINEHSCYNVKIISKTKKLATSVLFERQDSKTLENREIEYFNKINKERVNLPKKHFIIAISFQIKSIFGIKYLYPFSNEILNLYCIDDKQYVEFTLSGFSKEQVSENAIEFAQVISDFLSTQTNSIITIDDITFLTKKTVLSKKIKERIQEDDEWIDDYPIDNSHLILPQYAKELLKLIILSDNTDKQLIILKASHHYLNALKLDEKEIQNELIISQLMSSVEVLTELENHKKSKCNECGQDVYSIRKRVLSLIDKDLSPYLRKKFDHYYNTRSKYLHSGLLISSREYTERCLPIISDKFSNGCNEYPLKKDINLIEWIGFLIRKKTKETIQIHNKTLEEKQG